MATCRSPPHFAASASDDQWTVIPLLTGQLQVRILSAVRMKYRAEILAVETTGTSLRVKTQASAVRDARWRDMQIISIEVADTPAQRRAFHGRTLDIKVSPR